MKVQLSVRRIERYLSSTISKKSLRIKYMNIKPVMFLRIINPNGDKSNILIIIGIVIRTFIFAL